MKNNYPPFKIPRIVYHPKMGKCYITTKTVKTPDGTAYAVYCHDTLVGISDVMFFTVFDRFELKPIPKIQKKKICRPNRLTL